MNHELVVSGSIDISKGKPLVWDALTNPEIIKEYLFGTETITDWKVGNEIIFQGVYGDNKEYSYRDKGIITENINQERLSYTYWSGFTGLEDKPENYSLVTYTLTAEDNNCTNFRWTQKGFATEEAYRHSSGGIAEFLKKIKEVIER
jgi:uncharacterized protein YndB with AHSA1/START domain